MERIDLLVIGGGTAGIVAAKTAAGFGARVTLVERARTGGDCLWTGCVPSKALLAAAHAAAQARRAGAIGVHADVRVDFAAVMAHVRASIAAIAPVDTPEALVAAGVRVISGSARLTGPTTAVVDGHEVEFGRAILATGARPTVPGALVATDILTSETVWDLDELPGDLTVLGGGSIGCEMAQAFARLGSRVTVIEASDRLLPGEDRVASRLIRAALEADGVQVRCGTTTDGAGCTGPLLVAVGRTPNTDGLSLAAAGIDVDERGFVRVDRHLRTTNRAVWAAGDLTGHPQFTHVAGMHGSLAASNAVLGVPRTVSPVVPRVTFTDPEVAAVGVSVETARRTPGLTVRTVEHAHTDRAVAEANTSGSATLILDRRRRVVGASVIGPRAGDCLAELTLAVHRGLRARDLGAVTHPYPTYGDAVWNAALADVREQVRSPVIGRILRLLVRLRR